MIRRSLIAALALAIGAHFAPPAAAQAPGTPLPPVELEELTQTGAESFDDFLGRAVLIEFFAYW